MKHLAIIGGGSWGTALAIVLAPRFERVSLWVHEEDLAAHMQETRENDIYLPGFRLPANVDIARDTQSADVVLGVMPSKYARNVYGQLEIAPGTPIVSATKGIERGTLKRVSEIIEETLPGHPVAVLSGPTFAREIAKGDPAAIVIASRNQELASSIQTAFGGRNLRLYTNVDVIGVEIGAAMKNIIAIGAGICQGLGWGNNTIAALITRGLAEITRLAVAAGGETTTLAGLAGLGDLVLTCTGELSRNRKTGIELAQGKTIAEITRSTKMVAEGVETTSAATELAARLKVDVPITQQLGAILNGDKTPAAAIRELMERAPRGE